MKKIILLFLTVIFTAKIFASDVEYIHPFKLNPVNDGVQIGTSVALAGSALLCDKVFKIKDSTFNAENLNPSQIPMMEQFFMRPYSKGLDITGTVVCGSILLGPAIFAMVPSNEWAAIGVMYAESLAYAYGFKQWGKLLVSRTRPYMYFDDYPQEYVDDGDWNCSFPSGHTTLAFTGAAFTSYVFNQYFPDSKWRYAVYGISFGVAFTTGALRMASGNHFFTDVLTGAIIGTVCGFVVPYMHTTDFYKKFEKKNKNVDVAVLPTGFSVNIKM